MRLAWRQTLKPDWGHITVAALLLASLTYLLHHHTQKLGWLDALAARVAAAGAASPGSDPGAAARKSLPEVGDRAPQAILVSQTLYETAFLETSPLNRRVLAKLLRSFVTSPPKVLAIDLDLSPGPPGSLSRTDQPDLNQVLFELATSTKLVLAVPLPTQDRELRTEKVAWMHALCRAGVGFGLTSIDALQGIVVDYRPDVATLGRVAAEAAQRSPGSGKALPTQGRTPCEAAAQGVEAAIFMAPLEAPPQQSSERLPLGGEYLSAPTPAPISVVRPDDLGGRSWQGQVIFLGGSFESRDKHETAFGPRDGVLVQAAVYAAIVSPTRAVTGWQALVADVVFGVLVGVWLHMTVTPLRAAKRWAGRFHAVRLMKVPVGVFLQVCSDVAAACAFLLLVFLPVLAFFSLSATLLAAGLWLNPAPMILGLAVDALMNYAQDAHTNSQHDPNQHEMGGHAS